MLRKLLVLIVMTIVAPAPISDDAHATIIEYTNTNDGRGNYKFSFATSNGLIRREEGRLVNIGEPDEHITVRGMYSYIDSNGEKQVVRYTADDDGYVLFTQHVAFIPMLGGGPFFANITADVFDSLLGGN